MINSGMPKLSYGDIQYVRDALLPEATDIEATSAFTRSVIVQHVAMVNNGGYTQMFTQMHWSQSRV